MGEYISIKENKQKRLFGPYEMSGIVVAKKQKKNHDKFCIFFWIMEMYILIVTDL